MNIRQADGVRDYLSAWIIGNLTRTYNPSVQWDEKDAPFTDKNNGVLYCQQSGLPVDAYVRQSSVEISMFGKANAERADQDNLFNDATLALEYIKANPNINENLIATVTQDVTGPFYTKQNRIYYRFSVLTFSE